MNLYENSVPVFEKTLGNLVAILSKAKAYSASKGIPESELLEARLAPDMFPLTKQIQIVSDNAKGIAARLAGQEPPKMEDNEQSLDDLIARCNKTVAYLATLKPEQFEGAEERKIPFTYVEGKYLTGLDMLRFMSLPNFYFHATTAYDILRHKGLEIGKTDFIGPLPLEDRE
jgi:hypothetical protein